MKYKVLFRWLAGGRYGHGIAGNKRLLPEDTTNRNVPKDALLLFEESFTSGEVVMTYYVDGNGAMWKTGDWVTDQAHAVGMNEMFRVTGWSESDLHTLFWLWHWKNKKR